jgi:hypothetical protein
MSLHDHEAIATCSPDIKSPQETVHKSLETFDQALNNPHFLGKGTSTDPYVVDWDLGELANPFNWTNKRKWIITAQVFATPLESTLKVC